MKCHICNNNVKYMMKLSSPLGGLWNIYQCENCSIQFVYPIPSSEEINKFYHQQYTGDSTYRTKSLKDPLQNQRYWRRQWSLIRDFSGLKKGKVLDIGCGGGHFLDNAGLGWKKYGIELSDEAREISEEKGIESFRDLELTHFPDGFFNVITMFAVIEHLPRPKQVISEVSRLLKYDGLLVVMTGDVKSYKAQIKGEAWHMYRPPEHLFFFCARSLNFLMSINGLRNIKTIYTDGGMTNIPIKPINIPLRIALNLMERLPGIQSLPFFDHNYSYYRPSSVMEGADEKNS